MQSTIKRLQARRQEQDGQKGFTLIELLIVIVVLGILAAIVVFAVQNLTGNSSKSACGADLKTTETAVETYKAQVGSYPNATLPTGWTATPGTAAAAYTGTAASMNSLLGTATNGAGTVGPWLKDTPMNSGHYQISVANDGSGTITVQTTGASPTATTCSAVS
jgi:prepilin-type N-terminal cleavage/methylation domain-containing protein